MTRWNGWDIRPNWPEHIKFKPIIDFFKYWRLGMYWENTLSWVVFEPETPKFWHRRWRQESESCFRQWKSLQGRSINVHPPVTRGSTDGLCNRPFSPFCRVVSDYRCAHLETDRLLQNVNRTQQRQETNENGKAHSSSLLTRLIFITRTRICVTCHIFFLGFIPIFKSNCVRFWSFLLK
jgi:hypothetical protein